MRVALLEHPRKPSKLHYNDISNTPLWSCLMTGYAGACLMRAGFEATVIDATRWSPEETEGCLLRMPIDLLGVHAVYFWEHTESLMQMLSRLKNKGFAAPVCLFGFFPTLGWLDILSHVAAVDYVLVGEPEEGMVELARLLADGREPRFPGLATRIDGKTRLCGSRQPLGSLDRLPQPLRPDLENQETVSVLASRGCYNACAFCLVPTLDNGRTLWRARSPENVAAEIATLVTWGKSDFYFVDPNFVGPGRAGRHRVMQLSAILAELGITFGMETRASDVDSQLMEALANAGLRSLLLGIESASSSVLRRFGKNTSAAQNEHAISIVRATGIEPEIGFIMFEPQSTLDDISENFEFLLRNKLLDRLSRTANLLYHCQVAFKGTPGYGRALARGKLIAEGLFGFEGRLLYDDGRVKWLADLVKKISHYVLQEMEKKSSAIHWRSERDGGIAFEEVNACLVELFRELLSTARGFTSEPGSTETKRLLTESLGKVETAMAVTCRQGSHQGDCHAK